MKQSNMYTFCITKIREHQILDLLTTSESKMWKEDEAEEAN